MDSDAFGGRVDRFSDRSWWLGVGAEDFLGAVLRTIAQPVWVVDPEGLIRFANPAAIAALGYDTADDLIGRNSHETIHYRHPDGTPVSGFGMSNAAPADLRSDGRPGFGLVLPPRWIDVSSLLCLRPTRDVAWPGCSGGIQ